MTDTKHKRDFLVGVDLGQAADPSAIAILERFETLAGLTGRPRANTAKRYELSHIERPPLGTPYPKIVDIVTGRMAALRSLSDFGRVTLLVDATGVGRPVVDLMRGLAPIAVTITGGSVPNWSEGGVSVPKRDLVSTLAILLQSERLKISNELPEAAALVNELMNFKMKISLAGNETFEAWREKDHDDMVLGTAIAAWYGENHLPSIIPRPESPRLGPSGSSGPNSWMAN